MIDYKRKVRDLLALAGSSNEHEAKAALLKARELMVKYKISDASLSEINDGEVVRRHMDITYSARRDPWVPMLATTIAEHHCCRAIASYKKKSQTKRIVIIGFEGDADIVQEILTYAVDCVRSVTIHMRKKDVRQADGYGFGFTAGLYDAYGKQEESYGLVLVVPKEVDEQLSGLKKQKQVIQQANDGDSWRAYVKGVQDGRKFHAQKRLKGAETDDGK